MSIKLPRIGQGIGLYEWSDDNIAALRLGIDLGLTYIDTAEDYGMSEEVIGKATRDCRDKVILGTKFGPQHCCCDDIVKACENSLRRLHTDYIDLYQMHWPNPATTMQEIVTAFMKLIDQGKITHIGLGNLPFDQLVTDNYLLNITSLEMEYSLFDRYVERGILPFCRMNNIRLIAYSPIDHGRICPDFGKDRLSKIADKYHKTMAQVALSWLTRDSVTAIPTCRQTKHVKENAGANFHLEESDVQMINSVFEERLSHIRPSQISVSSSGQDNRKVYSTIDEARANELNLVPSPVQLASTIEDDIKPVRIIPSHQKDRYELVEGRIRYWAWVIARGDEPLPAYVKDNFES